MADTFNSNPKQLMQNKDFLRPFAQKYIWWKTPDDALASPNKIISQVMNIGEYDDVQNLIDTLGENTLIQVLKNSQIGEFNARSWAYWHYRLGLSKLNDLPQMPIRVLA